ncbi:MAG: disulfide bond formation protein DsbA [Candidatus Pacebacteria bacterium CG10_big_fil_rev_8_21_14_0_10_36_11]|nr:thioredoxin domain-containing protein [Candidatus Pacearchaeota archaeon]PIR64985.1 MAG: disulfide bond formation protein DsbA [Candidatus Pacebacteria bacterium CG10_big_fil_rev_8_21_14_0_10_36_11]PJC42357.1 MAG: disulfide bond formation protein DsbA [Candidatus Pacebacteria bacterium CG_4_9_14_0_2_um_filter_36_8]
MNNKTLTQIMIGAVALIAGFVAGSLWTENQLLRNGNTGNGQQVGAPTAAGNNKAAVDTLADMPALTAEDHLRGNKDAEITLVEYSDYECPFCNKFHPTMVKVMEEYGDKVNWVFRHYPLSFHAQAQISAEASECVASLGGNDAFWTFSDALFAGAAKEGAAALTEEKLIAEAGKVGVNNADMEKCLADGKMTDLVNEDMIGGQAAGVSGTPATILITKDGKRELISGALPYAQIKTVIDKYLK